MKVILLKPVPKLGKSGDIVEVSEGYARNALLPRKLAALATSSALGDLARAKAGQAAHSNLRQELLTRAIDALAGKRSVYQALANDHGNLFSQIHPKDIAEHLYREHRLAVDPKCIIVPGGSIKKTGDYMIRIEDRSVRAEIGLSVVAKN